MIKNDVTLGMNVKIYNPDLVNLYGCTIGNNTKIATFTEIQKDVIIGDNCKIEAFAFIPTGVTVGNGVFIGPHVCFTNDKYPKAVNEYGELLNENEWSLYFTTVKDNVSIGANTTIVCGITIGEFSKIGAGSIITKDVPPYSNIYGKY